MADETIEVEVAYATAEVQRLLKVRVNAAATLRDAIEASGILREFPEIDLETQKVGVFSKPAKLDQVLRSGDRVEIYRALIANPKEARKKRAAQKKLLR